MTQLASLAYGQVREGLAPSETDLVILFIISIALVSGLVLYIARDVIFRRRTEYDKGNAESKRNRDYEKYHSSWSDDYEEPGSRHQAEDLDLEPDAEDYYDIMGVSRMATLDEIKQRYRELAKEKHPDKSSGNSDAMARINKAYEVLSDKKLRSAYDAMTGG